MAELLPDCGVQCHPWRWSKSISSGAHYVTLRKYFSHPSLVMYSFATPSIKLKLWQQIGGGLLMTNHLDKPSLWWANQKHWVTVRSYLLHSFLQVHSATEPFTSHGNVRNYAEPKLFSLVKPAYCRFSSSIFTVQDHILSTAGDALTCWICKNLSRSTPCAGAPLLCCRRSLV